MVTCNKRLRCPENISIVGPGILSTRALNYDSLFLKFLNLTSMTFEKITMFMHARSFCLLMTLLCFDRTAMIFAADDTEPIVGQDVVFAEKEGLVSVEAEHFFKQTQTDQRAFHLTSSRHSPDLNPDGDPAHVAGASGGGYLEILPDTRRTHDDKLIKGENFSPEPGKMAVLSYKVHFANAGRYYVWVRAYSTGTEDNGLHVGIDGTWPESGQRLQWCQGKQSWHWESKQRTNEEHCGEPYKIYLDVETPGIHEIHFSMREDGFEFDKWLMTTDRDFKRPSGVGPKSTLHTGTMPKTFPVVAATQKKKEFPKHWGEPPQIQTRDYVPLPGGYGNGSSTLRNWIQKNLDADAAKQSSSPTKPVSELPLFPDRGDDGDGSVEVTGDLKTWHTVTVNLAGPFAHEQDNEPNPFTDYRMEVEFTHESGTTYLIPGFFAADGNAANSSAKSGTVWRALFAPDQPGKWNYRIVFVQGKNAALDRNNEAKQNGKYHDKTGSFEIAATDKSGRDLRAHGRLQYVGKRYLQFAGSKQYFLKAGADAPETLLAYADFDDTTVGNAKKTPLKTWQPHVKDWQNGDPTWKDGKGKGLIGAVNYLSGNGCNAFSFLTYNAGGDGDSVWPFIHRDDKLHYDCSKLDQWGIVFDHATTLGMYLHFKMQETENDDHNKNKVNYVPESLDGGNLGLQRKLYCRELIARFGHNLALNWNLGEENTQSTKQQQAMIDYIAQLDAYDHNIVIHTFPDQQDKIYRPLLGDKSQLTGVSLQNSNIKDTHGQTLKWVNASTKAGKPWIVAFDESGSAAHGQCPDLGYKGFDGKDKDGKMVYTEHDVRHQTLWGTLLAGGAGCEYYFGYKFVENDLVCEDWRSRDRSWDYCRIAVNFFSDHKIPFWDMENRDDLVGNTKHDNSLYCFAKTGDVYLIYLPKGGTTDLDLSETKGQFSIQWFNPRTGGDLQTSTVKQISGGDKVELGNPPKDEKQDWLLVVRKK